MQEPNNILSLLDNYMMTNPDDIAKGLADDFRRRRIEKNLTRDQIAELSNVAVSNIVIAIALGYTSEVAHIFSEPKYSTMEELIQIRKNAKKKKAYKG